MAKPTVASQSIGLRALLRAGGGTADVLLGHAVPIGGRIREIARDVEWVSLGSSMGVGTRTDVEVVSVELDSAIAEKTGVPAGRTGFRSSRGTAPTSSEPSARST